MGNILLGKTNLIFKTGQTTSYVDYDDGYYEKGILLTGTRFVDNSDGTITDNYTNLVWLKDLYFFAATRTWEQALGDCNGLADNSDTLTDGSSAGNWRLPNINELFSLIDYSQASPALSTGHPFINAQSTAYWSSTTVSGNTANAYTSNLTSGRSSIAIAKTGTYNVVAVRDKR